MSGGRGMRRLHKGCCTHARGTVHALRGRRSIQGATAVRLTIGACSTRRAKGKAVKTPKEEGRYVGSGKSYSSTVVNKN